VLLSHLLYFISHIPIPNPDSLFASSLFSPHLHFTPQELRLEIYRQSLIATGTARPQPAFAPPLVIPPAFAPQFVERSDVDADADSDSDVEMGDATAEGAGKTQDPRVQRLKQASAQAQAPFVFLIARCRSWEFGSSQN
jgi:hypothetical protein